MSAAHHRYHRRRAAGDVDAAASQPHYAARPCTCWCPQSSAPIWPNQRSSVSDRCRHWVVAQLQGRETNKPIRHNPLEHTHTSSTLTFRQIETHKDVEEQLHTDKRSAEAVGWRQGSAECSKCWRLWKDATGQWMSARMGTRTWLEGNHLREIWTWQRLCCLAIQLTIAAVVTIRISAHTAHLVEDDADVLQKRKKAED